MPIKNSTSACGTGSVVQRMTLRATLFVVSGVALSATSCLTPPPRLPKGAASEVVQQQPTYSGPSVAYEWKSVAINGGGFVTGLAFSPIKGGSLYARTDVGGAYRYDEATKRWLPLTDFLSHKQSNYMGVESIAVDPKSADRLYLAVGMYTAAWAGAGAFMRSEDRGATWKVFPVDFKMGGNDLSRSDGERLAIDPNMPNVIYFGSRRAGLLVSEDSAETWKKVDSFPVADDAEKGLGLPIVLFDPASGKPGARTQTLYVGSQVDHAMYRSKDAGKTWEKVAKQPELGYPPRRAALDKDGTLFVTYASGDSPYALSKGAVYKFSPKTSEWTDITPLTPKEGDTFGYGGISTDLTNPGTVIVATMDRWSKGAEVFRSLDSGKTWKPLMANATIDGGGTAHVYHHREKLEAPQWLGDIKIDPFNPDRALVVEGGGVWATWDLTGSDKNKPIHLSFHSNNIEEIVARDLISPPEGAPLLSVMLDACGMKHDDLAVSPAGGTFQNPACASSDDIDYAAKKPSVMVRVCNYPWDGTKGPRGAMSTDGGTSWKQFKSEPAGSAGLGSVAVSADGSVIVWAPREAKAAFSRDGGATWMMSAGLPSPAKSPDWAPWFLRLAADSVNPKKFYALNALTGEVFLSDDGGAHFAPSSEQAKAVPEYELQYASIKPVFDHEGEIWITTKAELLRSTNGGKSFSTVDGIQEAHAVGFGKAPPGKNFPTVFLSGKISDQTGFFRSDDNGDSFVRINDDLHQYGGSTVLTGDPRVYGRVYLATGGRGIVYGEPKK